MSGRHSRCSEVAGVSASDRVLYGSRVLEIVGVTNVGEENTWLKLDCKEQV